MTKRKVDRRILRTRRQLAEAMLSLLLEKNYDAITIQDITERADLNRATFYLHYGAKDDLLVNSLEARFDELVAQMEQIVTPSATWEDNRDILMVYQHVEMYSSLYQVLLGENGRAYVINRIIDYIAEVGMRFCEMSLGPSVQTNPLFVMMSRHIAGSLYALLTWWLTEEMPYSAEKMTEITHELQLNGMISFLQNQNRVHI
jgi:AcrR family transcriptional regulator